jgi:hypothetical protein
MTMSTRLVSVIAACLLAFPAFVSAQPPEARHRMGGTALPPGGEPYGQSYGEWAVDWWKWAIRAPTPVNPVADMTGEHCAVGQRGHVWFLAGSLNGDTIVRHCTIPAGRALFFPIVNIVWIGFPEDPPITADEITAIIDPMIAEATGLEVLVNGVPVPDLARYLVTSPLFSAKAPADNIFGYPGKVVFTPCLDEGFYVMLTPLAPGSHTLVIRGTSPFGTQDVTYFLEVGDEH